MKQSPEHAARSKANARLAKAIEQRDALKAQVRALKAALVLPKWLRTVRDGGVRVLTADENEVTALVTGEHSEHVVSIYRDEDGRTVRECDCENAKYHPVHPRCSHMQAIEAIYRLEPK